MSLVTGPRVLNVSMRVWPEGAIYIGRSARYGYSKWSNKFRIGVDGNRAEVIAKYEAWVMQQFHLLACLPEIEGAALMCHCAPRACHGDILWRLANE